MYYLSKDMEFQILCLHKDNNKNNNYQSNNLITIFTSVTTYATTLYMNCQNDTFVYVIIKLNLEQTKTPEIITFLSMKCGAYNFDLPNISISVVETVGEGEKE